MKKLFLITAICMTAAAAAFADGLTISDSNGDPSQVDAAAGSSFTVTMNLIATNPPEADVVGFSLWLGTAAANNGFFQITSNVAGPTFRFHNQDLPGGGTPIIFGGDATDLGYTGPTVASDSTYDGGTLTISIGAGVAPGVYTIFTNVTNPKASAITSGDFVSYFTTSSIYTINVQGSSLPTVTMSATDRSASEVPANDTGKFRITRSGSTTADLAMFYTISGTATNGTDYQRLRGRAVIRAGAISANVQVRTVDDTIHEPDETVILTLSPNASYTIGSPNTGTVTIHSDE